MNTYTAPETIPETGTFLFLAGTIDMGASENWQEHIADTLRDTKWTILNPRRQNWDSSWVLEMGNNEFTEQVTWELNALERADRILMYFAPSSQSPISLLELGLFARTGKLLVVCPSGFWRKGNIDIVCERYGVERADTLEEAIQRLRYACVDGNLPARRIG